MRCSTHYLLLSDTLNYNTGIWIGCNISGTSRIPSQQCYTPPYLVNSSSYTQTAHLKVRGFKKKWLINENIGEKCFKLGLSPHNIYVDQGSSSSKFFKARLRYLKLGDVLTTIYSPWAQRRTLPSPSQSLWSYNKHVWYLANRRESSWQCCQTMVTF